MKIKIASMFARKCLFLLTFRLPGKGCTACSRQECVVIGRTV
jgi:hypothetical protein